MGYPTVEMFGKTWRVVGSDPASGEPIYEEAEKDPEQLIGDLFGLDTIDDIKEFNESTDRLDDGPVELTGQEIVDLSEDIAKPGPNKAFFVPEAPGRVGVSDTPSEQPDFSKRAGKMIPFEIARPDWDKVVPHTEVMGTINPGRGRDAGFKINKWVKPNETESIEAYDMPFEYGIGLDGVVPIAFSEAKVRSNSSS